MLPGAERTVSLSGMLSDFHASLPGQPTQAYSAQLLARPGDRGIQLTGSIKSVLTLTCDRCAETFELQVTGEVDVLLSGDIEAAQYEGESTLVELDPADRWVDLAEPLREALLLAMPQKRLCRPTCKGLCSQCGSKLIEESCSCEALAHDDRWAALLDIKEKLEQT